VFNTADWLGRALPAFPRLVITNKKALIVASASRAVFIPLILLCNIAQSSSEDIQRFVLITSDTAYLTILALFAVSNGYLTSLLMMRAITDPELQQDERDVASSLMLLYLVGGLAMGAILSFVLSLLFT